MHATSVAVRERSWSYIQILNCSAPLADGCCFCRNYFNLAKVSTTPRTCTAALLLGQRVDHWLHANRQHKGVTTMMEREY